MVFLEANVNEILIYQNWTGASKRNKMYWHPLAFGFNILSIFMLVMLQPESLTQT